MRDGNVRLAYETLPAGIPQRYFCGDSACHESGLIGGLADPARAYEPDGRIGFRVSAVMKAAAVACEAEGA